MNGEPGPLATVAATGDRRTGLFLRELGRSPITVAAAGMLLVLGLGAASAPLIAPQDPFDPASLDLMNSLLPPAWSSGGEARFPLGTDDQGRDLLSSILFGMRSSLLVALSSVALALSLGVMLGLAAGYFGGLAGAVIMRIADVQLGFPAILIALLIDGIATGLAKGASRPASPFVVLALAIGLSFWVQYARTVRAATIVEAAKDYVQAARLSGRSAWAILVQHILPNVSGPVLVLATLNLAMAVTTEATLSFLGVGLPPTQPSLGTLIRTGNDFLFSGEWWVTVMPGVALAMLVVSANLSSDWLRRALDPRLR